MESAPMDQGAMESCEGWHYFNLSLPPQSMDSDISDNYPWFLIAQAQKIGVLQVVVSDENAYNQIGKLSNPPSLISLTYFHYFHTLIISSQELAFPGNQLLNLFLS